MIRQPEREQLNRLTIKTLDHVLIVARYYTAEALPGQPPDAQSEKQKREALLTSRSAFRQIHRLQSPESTGSLLCGLLAVTRPDFHRPAVASFQDKP
jgi:hypothetical protein